MKLFLVKLFDFLVKLFISITGINKGNKIGCRFQEHLSPTVDVPVKSRNQNIRLKCPNLHALWRADTFHVKEPETLKWIDSFKEGEKLLDIGANVGLYTIYAAMAGHQVYAIEPESQNYALLSQNLHLNKLSNKVVGLNIALSDNREITKLFISTFAPAMALHTVAKAEDFLHREMNPAFEQGVLALQLDDLMEWSGDFFPEHVKIDVDGAEARIIAGGEKTFSDPRLKSLLIELNEELECDMQILKTLESWGFNRHIKEQSDYIKTTNYTHTYNYILYKD
jgi:FkbM family methyltransferase